jgi:peptidoglycan/xylan/chitin deacetylase (PgdA/CDA1 family)
MKYLSDEISLSLFQQHMDYLISRYDFISLDELIEKDRVYEHPNSIECSLSFDDGLYSVYKYAYPILKSKKIPFTVFINTSVIGNKSLLWLHLLGYLVNKFGIKFIINEINEALDRDHLPKVCCEDSSSLESWCRKNIEYLFESKLLEKLAIKQGLNIEEIACEQNIYLNWDQINEMRQNGVTFFSHTDKHFPLNGFTNIETIKAEILNAKLQLNSHIEDSDTFISFPFGMLVDYGSRAENYALEVGHEYIVEVGNGINSPLRIDKERKISRVGLGMCNGHHSEIYAAIELRPLLKMYLKKLIWKRTLKN